MSGPTPPNEPARRRWNDPEWVVRWLGRERLTAFTTERLLGHLDPVPAERLLDVGCGTGRLSATLARVVGPGGAVFGVDLSERLIEVARERARAAALDNAVFVVADAQVDPVADAPFDAVTSQFGVMFFDDPTAAFANLVRQVVEDGRLAFVTWQRAEQNPWYVMGALAPFLPPELQVDPGAATGPFAMADPGPVLAMLGDAGWNGAACAPYEEVVAVDRSVLIGNEERGIPGVAAADLAEAVRVMENALEPFRRDENTYEVTIAFQVFTARRG